jgi:hypothetical protein
VLTPATSQRANSNLASSGDYCARRPLPRNKTEISGHSLLAATEYAVLGGGARVAFSLLGGMAAVVAAMWDQHSGWRIIAQK